MPNEAQADAFYSIENEGVIFRLGYGFRWKTPPSAAIHPDGVVERLSGGVI